MPLTWALVIPTFRRAEILPRCIRLAVAQTRPPAEIIIIDASEDWKSTRDTVRAIVDASPHAESITLHYEAAHRRSSAAQRNQGLEIATADILFFIDDDSLMLPDCAAEVMRIYEADPERQVAGISPILAPSPPDAPTIASIAEPSASNHGLPHRFLAGLRDRVRRLLSADQIFLPYDYTFPHHEIPPALQGMEVGLIHAMHGCRMTFRREVIAAERFSEILAAYSLGEDSDASHRCSRRGMLLNAVRAKLFHAEHKAGRLSTYTVTALGALNPTVLHRIHGADPARSQRLMRRLLRRRLLIQFLKDISRGDWRLPRMRGIAFALRHINDVFARNPEELATWYPALQKQLVERNLA